MMKQEMILKRGDGDVILYTMENAKGASVSILNYGATITRIMIPGAEGQPVNMLYGWEKTEDFLTRGDFLGATIGRVANRIADGKFELDGKEYSIPRSENGVSALHGGNKGFDKYIWKTDILDDQTIQFSHHSPDGDQGFPGNLDVSVTMSLTDDNILRLSYAALADRRTPLNMTNHAYFNLAGGGTVLNHELTIEADYFTPMNEHLIPTGEILPVAGTVFDFTKKRAIGEKMDMRDPQIQIGGGYDHNFVVRGEGLRRAATMYDPSSGRGMYVYTDMPAMQLYTSNMLRSNLQGACCFETQFYPDSMNHSVFPSCVLDPGKDFSSVTEYRFFSAPEFPGV